MSWILNPRITGTVVAIDGEELWLIHRSLSLSRDFDAIDRDQFIRDVLGVDEDFSWEVIHHQDWTARRLVASKFRDNNVFIRGDAAHIWIPFAGCGMNAGIADCTNLSRTMAAVLNEQADEKLLDAHERERHPITEQVSQLAMAKALENMSRSQRRVIPKDLEEPGSIGDKVRRELGEKLDEINVPQFACEGLNFGYYYDDSPIIEGDGEQPPAYDMGSATPNTVPGCRLPHFWIDGERSLYDQLGPVYTLLNFSCRPVDESLTAAFSNSRLPVAVLDFSERPAPYEHDLVLARTDQHVAWRGDAPPADLKAFVARLSGRAVKKTTKDSVIQGDSDPRGQDQVSGRSEPLLQERLDLALGPVPMIRPHDPPWVHSDLVLGPVPMIPDRLLLFVHSNRHRFEATHKGRMH